MRKNPVPLRRLKRRLLYDKPDRQNELKRIFDMKNGKNGNPTGGDRPSLRNGSMATSYYRFLTRHLLGHVEKARLSPNQISLIGVLCAAVVPLGFAVHPFVGLLFLVFSAMADSLDGLVARKRNQATAFGAFLDDSLDRVADFLYLVGFWVLFWSSRLWLPATVLTLSAIGLTQVVSYIGIRSALAGMRCPEGILGRTARTVYLIAWAGLIVCVPGGRPAIMWMGLVLYNTLVLTTLIQRILYFRRFSSPT